MPTRERGAPSGAAKKRTGKSRPLKGPIVVRPLRIEDFDDLVRLQEACFPGMSTWTREQIESQLAIFPEGQIAVEYENRLIASSSSLIVNFEDYVDWHNWSVMSDHGYIRNHDPEGDTLYGIEIMVDPQFRGFRLSRRLYEARKNLCRDRNLARIIIGGRIPGYGQHADRMTAREYVERVLYKELFDPVLTAQMANGFMLKQLIPDYYPADTASRGYATFLEWTNLEFVPDLRRRYQAVRKVRVAAVQYEMREIRTFDEFARQCEFFVDSAADYRSDFLIFPELFTTQLLSLTPALRPGLAARRLAEYTDEFLDLFKRLAVKFNVNIVGGSQFCLENEKLYNVAHVFRRDGTVERQYKLHITPSEQRWWGVSPGSELKLIDTDCARIVVMVCYDIEFPELARWAAAKGAQIIFVPFNTNDRYGYLRVRYCAQARCVENHVYVVTAGCTGNLPNVENADIHYAQSSIFTPSDYVFSRDGIAAECTPNIETVLVNDIDLELLRRHRVKGTTLNLKDRRSDLYKLEFFNGEDKSPK